MRILALVLAVLVWSAMHVPVAGAQAVGGAGFETWEAGANDRVMVAGLGTAGTARSVGRVGLGAAAGAALGVIAVGVIGYHLDRATECNDDFCGIDGILLGGSLGATVLAPLGAHLANDRRGRLVPSLLAAAAGTGAVWLVAAAFDDEEIILAVPFVNIITSIIVERATSP